MSSSERRGSYRVMVGIRNEMMALKDEGSVPRNDRMCLAHRQSSMHTKATRFCARSPSL